MMVKILEKITFVYIVYHRSGPEDFSEFRKVVVNALKKGATFRDIVVDLTPNTTISAPEKNLLQNTAITLLGSNRRLRIIAPPEIRTTLDVLASENVLIYDSHSAVLKSMNRAEEYQPQPPAAP